MTNKEAAKLINNFLNGPEYENPRREEVEAMAYAVDVLAKSNTQKSVIIIKSNSFLDHVTRTFYEDKFRKDYESGILMVPEFFDVTVVGNADGVEVRRGEQ